MIVVSDFLFDGLRFVIFASDAGIAHERAFAPVGAAVASLFAGASPASLAFGLQASYWVQMITVFSFLVLLPLGEHFHIVTALPAVFLARETPLNRVPSVDLEAIMADDAGDDMKVGAKTVADLVWKDAFDAFTCTECGRCKDSCPTFLTGKPLALKWVNDSLKHHLLEKREAILAGREAELPALVREVIKEETLWACTTCGYCERACPIGLEHLGRFYRLRQHQVMMEGAFPQELKAVFDAYESQSNPWGLPADTRGAWAKDLGVPVLESAEQAKEIDWLFYVGSAQSFDNRAQKTARAFVKILQAAGVRFAILGAARGLHGRVRAPRRQRDALPVARPGARRDAERAGGEAHRHLRPARVQLAQERVSGVRRQLRGGAPHAAHRPAHPGREDRAEEDRRRGDLPRALLPRAPQRRVRGAAPRAGRRLEGRAARVRDARATRRCAAGPAAGACGWRSTSARASTCCAPSRPSSARPSAIATACPYCAIMLRDGVAQLGRGDDIPTKDIAEFVADALPSQSD